MNYPSHEFLQNSYPKFEGDAGATFSTDLKHRYALWRVWDRDKPLLSFVMLNPSSVSNYKNDSPTIAKCVKYAKKWDFGGILVGNLYSVVSSTPEILKTENHPVGPDTDFWLRVIIASSDYQIAGWGNGMLASESRIKMVLGLGHKRKWLCFGFNRDGSPQHPLYVRSDIKFHNLKNYV